MIGERGQVVKATGCGSVIREFDSRRSPLKTDKTYKQTLLSQFDF
jgi:hypothetical protein